MYKYTKDVNKCLLRLHRGDASAMETLFDITANHLKVVILYYLNNKSFLDDSLLQTYERAYNYIDSFKPSMDGYNWMCRIAQNVAFDYNKQEASAEYLDNVCTVAQEDWTFLSDLKLDMNDAVKGFTAMDRKILYLRYYLQKTLDEIAAEVGFSKTAVSKHLKQIENDIRAYYKRD